MWETFSRIYMKLWLEGSVADLDQNPHGSAFNLPPGSGSGFGMQIRIWLQNADPDIATFNTKSRNLL
jgi:hypothetical protein